MGKALDTRQQTFFNLPPNRQDISTGENRSIFIDPSCANNKSAPIHRWVPWIAGFSNEFVAGALDRHLGKRGMVLDPFAGVGTTLIEAALAGHDAIGFEINPYAALACRTKLNAHRTNLRSIRRMINSFRIFYTKATEGEYEPRSKPPAGFKTRTEFYSPKVLHKVLIAQDFINQQREGTLQDLFRIAFASTMVTYSNYSYEPSLSRRVSAGKAAIDDFPVGDLILNKLREMFEDVQWMSGKLNGRIPATQVFNESFFESHDLLDTQSVDMIITSPPYLNNYHYNRNTRPHMYWLEYASSPRDFVQLENENFGKYWQTVRELERVDLEFPMPDKEIIDCLTLLRTMKPEKGIYGGNGWANYAASYFNDCYRFALIAKRILKRRGTALIVIGNNILQGIMVPTDRFLGKIAENVGLQLVDIHIPRATRIGNSIIKSKVRVGKAGDSDQLYEAVVELRKR